MAGLLGVSLGIDVRKNLIVRHRECVYWMILGWRFMMAMSSEATRQCDTIGQCAGPLPRLIADAYLMGGEL